MCAEAVALDARNEGIISPDSLGRYVQVGITRLKNVGEVGRDGLKTYAPDSGV